MRLCKCLVPKRYEAFFTLARENEHIISDVLIPIRFLPFVVSGSAP